MLDNALTTQLKTYLEMVREPIVLVPSLSLIHISEPTRPY